MLVASLGRSLCRLSRAKKVRQLTFQLEWVIAHQLTLEPAWIIAHQLTLEPEWFTTVYAIRFPVVHRSVCAACLPLCHLALTSMRATLSVPNSPDFHLPRRESQGQQGHPLLCEPLSLSVAGGGMFPIRGASCPPYPPCQRGSAPEPPCRPAAADGAGALRRPHRACPPVAMAPTPPGPLPWVPVDNRGLSPHCG